MACRRPRATLRLVRTRTNVGASSAPPDASPEDEVRRVREAQRVRERDASLAAAAAGGDDAAFEQIVSEHGPRVMRLGMRLLGDRADAEDLLQDVFVRVHRSLDGFRADANLATWITRVTINAARNRVRDARRRRRHVTDSLDEPVGRERDDTPTRAELLASDGAGPERLALAGEAARRIADALAALPPEFREVLVLREVEQLAYSDIVQATGLELGTVKSRIARGRQRLQLALGDLARSDGGLP